MMAPKKLASAAVVAMAAMLATPATGQIAVRYYSAAGCSNDNYVSAWLDPDTPHCWLPEAGSTSYDGLYGTFCNNDGTVSVYTFRQAENILDNCQDDVTLHTKVYPQDQCVQTDAANDKLAKATGPYQKWFCGIKATALIMDQSLNNVYRQSCTSDTCAVCGAQPVEREAAECIKGVGYSKRFSCNWLETKVKVLQWDNEECDGSTSGEYEYDANVCSAVDSNEEDIDFPNQKFTCGTTTNDGGSSSGGSSSGGSSTGGSAGGSGSDNTGGNGSAEAPAVLATVLAAVCAVLFIAA